MPRCSFVDLSRERSASYSERTAFRFLDRLTNEKEVLSLGALDREARALAAVISERAKVGDRALLLFPPGPGFIRAFWGCLYAGVIAVPCYPPGLTRASEQAVGGILLDSAPSLILTTREWMTDGRIRALASAARTPVTWLDAETTDVSRASEWREPSLTGESIAFLQYTSGSTGAPKGVMITHGNLLANVEMIERAFCASSEDRVCLWLPPYHDMGLIGGILGSVYANSVLSLMAPAEFLRAPLNWLKAVSDSRATISGAPNFAFDLCVRAAAAKPQGSLALDLSGLELMFNGAEVVRPDTLRRFSELFGAYGFRPEAFAPCYGMAECTLLCSIAPRRRGAKVFQRVASGAARHPDAAGAGEIVGCGYPVPGQQVVVVNPESGTPCEDGVFGEVWISGPHVAKGYWGKSEESERVFGARLTAGNQDRFLRTGDQGFFADGELHLVGRYKNVIIVRGRNFAAEDIEGSVRRAHAAVKAHRVVAFPTAGSDGDDLNILFECESEVRTGPAEELPGTYQAILNSVKQCIVEDHGLVPKDLAIVAAGQLPVTTSGKVRRQTARALLQNGSLRIVARANGEEALTSPAPRQARPALVEGELLQRVREVLFRHAGREVPDGTTLAELGLDSIQATEIGAELSDLVGFDLPPSALNPDATLSTVVAIMSGQNTGAARPTNPLLKHGELAGGESFEIRVAAHARQVQALKALDLINYHHAYGRKLGSTRAELASSAVTFFSSYSYLSLNTDSRIQLAKVDAILRYGSGGHGVMLLGGYTTEHEALEREIAVSQGTEDALLFSSGYIANLAVIDAVIDRDGVIFCDQLVHTSICDGCRLSGADVRMFPHQDADALDRMLARRPPGKQALVIVDGVYSLRGDVANLPPLLAAAQRHGAQFMVDDSHGFGAVGEHGRGTAEHHGVLGQVDLITSGLGKGIPAYGGFVAGKRAVIDYLRFRSRPYVYSGGMDVSNVAAARRALEILRSDPGVMERLRANIATMARLLQEYGIPSLRWGTPCSPVVCRDELATHTLSREMLRRGFYIAPIVYPAVPKDQQGLRLTVTAGHTEAEIRRCVAEIASAMNLGPAVHEHSTEPPNSVVGERALRTAHTQPTS